MVMTTSDEVTETVDVVGDWRGLYARHHMRMDGVQVKVSGGDRSGGREMNRGAYEGRMVSNGKGSLDAGVVSLQN